MKKRSSALSEYEYKTTPFKHQKEYFDKNKDVTADALFWEQGCGKTKPVIDKASYLYLKGEIDAVVVIAPNGVHRNWLTDEIPAHMPDKVVKETRTFLWNSDKSCNKSFQKEQEFFIKHKGLAILTMSYDAVMTKRGKAFLWRFLARRKCHMVADEGHYMKTASAKRTKRLYAASKYPAYKTLLTGTPIATGPFDIFSQIKFLDEYFWHDHGLGMYSTFKRYFGQWITRDDMMEQGGFDPGYDQLVGYKNVEKLESMITGISHRLTKEDAGLDLPPKLYSKRYFELTSVQRKAYEELKEEYMTELDCGEVVEAGLAIVRLLRFQQITCGYVGTEVDEPVIRFEGKNPRMEALKEIISGLSHKAIIWSRFTEDINQIMELLGDRAVRYDGQVTDDEKAANKVAFQKGDAEFFVGNPMAGATGLTLHAAKTVIYYSNSFNFVDRAQSEDRAHRIGQDQAVSYIDIVAIDSVDQHITENLVRKLDISNLILGDEMKEWI